MVKALLRVRTLSTCAFLCALAMSACVRTATVRVPMTFAARVPVRVFPSIWVAAGEYDEDQRIADRLAAHLAKDSKIEVRRVDLAELEPARVAGKIPVSTAVVILNLELREGVQQYWDTVPTQSCGYYYGCTTQYRSFVSTMPAVTGMVTLTVHEGPTSRVLQHERVGRTMVGNEPENARLDLVEALSDEVEHLVDAMRVNERVTLVRVGTPEVEAALSHIEAGDWAEGRRLLETAKSALGGMKRKQQARIWYDLALARRFAPGENGLDDAAYQASLRAFKWALRLEPRAEYQRALIKLQRNYESVVSLAEQERARKHNFAAAAESGSPAPQVEFPVPEPPPAAQAQ